MPQVEERSLIRLGKSLVISLPKPWVDFYKLEPGDRLELVSNGKITISPGRPRGIS